MLTAAILALALYFVPTVAAALRTHPHTRSIAIVNTVFGWTVLGWCLCLVWSLLPLKGRSVAINDATTSQPDTTTVRAATPPATTTTATPIGRASQRGSLTTAAAKPTVPIATRSTPRQDSPVLSKSEPRRALPPPRNSAR